MFTTPALLALARLVLPFLVLVVAAQINRRLSRYPITTQPVPGWAIWLGGLAVAFLLAWALDVREAMETLQMTGDFFIVVFRTVLYVLVCVPLFFVLGLVLALILNGEHIIPPRASTCLTQRHTGWNLELTATGWTMPSGHPARLLDLWGSSRPT